MAMETNSLSMKDLDIKVYGSKESDTAKESKHGMMGPYMKVNGIMIRLKEKANMHGLMEGCIMGY